MYVQRGMYVRKYLDIFENADSTGARNSCLIGHDRVRETPEGEEQEEGERAGGPTREEQRGGRY